MMKHINESIIGRRGGGSAFAFRIYLMEASYNHKGTASSSETHAALYLTQEEYNNRINDILSLPGLKTAKGYINSLIRIGGDVILWVELDGMGEPRFFCQSLKLIYGTNKITDLPLKSIGYTTCSDRFEIVRQVGITNLDAYNNIFDCFEKNKFFHNLK